MVGNNERSLFHSLFRAATACVIGFSVIELIDRLMDELKQISEQYEKRILELEVEDAVDEFMEALEDAREKKFNDSVEECISGIRKDFEAEIKKKPDDDQKVCSDSLEECLSDVRKVLESSVGDRNRGILNDEKLVSDVEECLTDIKKLLK